MINFLKMGVADGVADRCCRLEFVADLPLPMLPILPIF